MSAMKADSPVVFGAREELERRIVAAYDWYYSQQLECTPREPGAPDPKTYDGVDPKPMPQVNAHMVHGGILKEGTFEVPLNRKIVAVTYECKGDACGWCYNPDGGYAPWLLYDFGGTKVHWRRLYDGRPVDETYRVYWKSLKG